MKALFVVDIDAANASRKTIVFIEILNEMTDSYLTNVVEKAIDILEIVSIIENNNNLIVDDFVSDVVDSLKNRKTYWYENYCFEIHSI